jgi:hypothetical protein
MTMPNPIQWTESTVNQISALALAGSSIRAIETKVGIGRTALSLKIRELQIATVSKRRSGAEMKIVRAAMPARPYQDPPLPFCHPTALALVKGIIAGADKDRCQAAFMRMIQGPGPVLKDEELLMIGCNMVANAVSRAAYRNGEAPGPDGPSPAGIYTRNVLLLAMQHLTQRMVSAGDAGDVDRIELEPAAAGA